MTAFRNSLAAFLERRATANFILGVILFNALILGLETSAQAMAQAGGLIRALDALCLTIFVIEIGAKLLAYGPRFFRSGWNLFDALIVGIALVPSGQGLSVLRALRILRLLRVISVAPRLRQVVEGFLTALPGMASVFLLMGIIFYVGAVMATKLFGAAHPQMFGDLGASALTLFQVMTLDSWFTGVTREVMADMPWAWAFFLPFVLVTTFAVVNLVVGLIVNSMQDAHQGEENLRTDLYRNEVLDRLRQIEARLEAAENARRGE
ncbi:MAG: ion transporter [Paracoccus sp. (in: a-proteobacteria)]|nr:ion transporter [Paracoccus sp. (in: a-proteobacteria)]